MADAKRILVVEDTKSYSWLISQQLNKEGFLVSTAENGQEGLDIITDTKPDLILLDIEMPIMDGVTMAKKLKEQGSEIPIIFLTNMSDMAHISEASDIATEYVVKSDTKIEDIIERVKNRLK
jgi:DNA-binding response OmpR family regulator